MTLAQTDQTLDRGMIRPPPPPASSLGCGRSKKLMSDRVNGLKLLTRLTLDFSHLNEHKF